MIFGHEHTCDFFSLAVLVRFAYTRHIHGHICILLGSCLVYLKILLGLFSGIFDALFVCKEKAMGMVK